MNKERGSLSGEAIGGLIGLILIFIIIVSIISVSACDAIKKGQATRIENAKKAETERRQGELKQKEIEAAKAIYKLLMPYFNIEDSNTYRHKAFSKTINGNGTTIKAYITDNTLKSYSVYVGNSRKNHDDFQVLTESITKGRIRIIGGKTEYKVIDGKSVETVELDKYDTEWLLGHIAEADKTKDKWVAVILASKGKVCYEYDLPAKHREAIRYTVAMHKALQTLKEANIDLSNLHTL